MKFVISFILLVLMFSSCRQAPTGTEFPFKPYSQQALNEAVKEHKPVIIDFWAEWCPNCHDLDRAVFSRPDIKAKMTHVMALRMDVTNQDDPKVQQILEKYDIEGVPTVVFLDRHGKEINNARVIGFVTPEEFLQSLALLSVLK